MVEELAKWIMASGIALGAIAWLCKELMKLLISKDIESHKAQLSLDSQKAINQLQADIQRETGKELARLGTDLAVYAHAQQVAISRLDMQRSESIVKIWRMTVDWMETANDLAGKSIVWRGDQSQSPADANQVATHQTQDAEKRIAEFQQQLEALSVVASQLRRRILDDAILYGADARNLLLHHGGQIRTVSEKISNRESVRALLADPRMIDQSAVEDIRVALADLREETDRIATGIRNTLLSQIEILMKVQNQADSSASSTT